MILHSLKGVPVNDTSLAIDVIKEMGIGKDYLSHQTTLEHMRSQSQQIYRPQDAERLEADGSKDAYQRSHERMIEILETYEPPQLPADVLKKVRAIVVEAEEELGVHDDDKEG